MRTHLTILLLMLFSVVNAQDTIIVNNNFKYKVGIKLSSEGTSDIMYDGNHHWVVFGGGIQLVRKINKSGTSLESGIYYATKAKGYETYYYDSRTVYTQYVTVPFNLRYDSKVIYVAAGVFCDYLVNRFSKYPISEINYYGDDRKFNIGFDLEIGVEKQISQAVNFYVEGKFFDTISSPKQRSGGGLIQENFRTSYRNYGVSIGVNYKFLHKAN